MTHTSERDHAAILLRLREGVSIELLAEGEIVLEGAGIRFAFGRLDVGLRSALQGLAAEGEQEGRLADLVGATDGPDGLARLYYFLQRLAQRGLLTWTVQTGGHPLAVLVPTSSSFAYASWEVSTDRSYGLSRFAYSRRFGSEMIVESPLAHGRVVVRDGRVASLLHALATPGRIGDLASRCLVLSIDEISLLLVLLLNAALVELMGSGAADPNERVGLQTWEFHDLLFHARSRNGRHDQPVGATYRFLGQLAPPPALEPSRSEETVELYRPNLQRLQLEDPPFAQVQEARSSIRTYGDRPISAQQLGEFLYRVARVKDHLIVEVPSPQGPFHMEVATRPYPGGGALHELEIYVAVNSCEDLAPGLYHYDPLSHRLGLRRERTAEVARLLQYAGLSIDAPPEQLQLLLVVAARFPRVAWKYASVAYALILKDVGVIFQTMYLVATAMGLAPCALGGGDSELFSHAAGVDYFAESSVGEFLLGSKPESSLSSD